MSDEPSAPDKTAEKKTAEKKTAEKKTAEKKTAKKKAAKKKPTRQERIRRKVARLPREPGVYLMKGRDGKVFYVGKASSLRDRVRSYFNASGDTRTFVALLDRILVDLDFVVTANEKEALLLENNLIKEHRPRYNIKLRDDKNYLALRLDTRQTYPRLELVRRIRSDGARYFGPYHSAQTARRQKRLLNKFFQLRVCSDRTLASRTRPCLNHQIGRCLAPCTLPVDPALYAQRVADVALFLSGRGDELARQLEQRMRQAAEREQFEEAARLRDLIADLEAINAEQHVVEAVGLNQDVLGLHREGDRVLLCLMTIRQGRLIGSEEIALRHQEFPDQELLSSFLGLHYEGDRPLPDEILVPVSLPDAEVLGEWLTERRGKKVRLATPQRGYRKRLLEMAERNARASWEARSTRSADAEEMLEKLQRRLRLGRAPQRIECYDISTLQGAHPVGSMAVMIDGELSPKLYRHFNVRTVVDRPDDYAALREVLGRRFTRAHAGDEGWEPPDLLLIDGGKGQLNIALTVLADLGIEHGGGEMAVASLAKERASFPGAPGGVGPPRLSGAEASPGATRAAEGNAEPIVDRVFLPGIKDPIRLRPNTAELFLLARLRDEAHRFAITHHRARRRKSALRTSLLDIPGVGEKRAKALLRHFGSVRAIQQASLEELREAPQMSLAAARAVHTHFHDVD